MVPDERRGRDSAKPRARASGGRERAEADLIGFDGADLDKMHDKMEKKETDLTEPITITYARRWVEPRVSRKRFQHIAGVAAVGVKLAKFADVESYDVELACWLHDACKEMKKRL